jgi:catechol 2,3-dioxygenase-like lactoylglutathione lyase family enzyme
MFKIQQLSSVSLRTQKLAQCEKFYGGPWGLQSVDSASGSALFRGTGPAHHVLELIEANDTGLDKISFSVADEKEVDDAAAQISAAGYELDIAPTQLMGTGGGYGLLTRDPDGNAVEIRCGVEEHEELTGRPELLTKVDHIVLNSPNVDAIVDFYSKVLGLRVSDWYEEKILTFLTCNEEHHCLVIAKAESNGIQHIAFEVKGLEALMRGMGRLRKTGLDPIWGPGRHAPGGNTFSYYADPNGYVVELTSDQFTIDEAWQPKEWKRSVENADMWGTAGAPTELVLKLWSGAREGFELESDGDVMGGGFEGVP